jgi:hypothetical protein
LGWLNSIDSHCQPLLVNLMGSFLFIFFLVEL